MEPGGGASVPYGGPIVEMDALIGVKCIPVVWTAARFSIQPVTLATNFTHRNLHRGDNKRGGETTFTARLELEL